MEFRITLRRKSFCLKVDVQLPTTGVTVLFGPSGCGKTTFLRAAAGLEQPDEGLIRVAGQTWFGPDQCLPPHKRPIGYVFQEPSLFPHLNVAGNLRYGLRRNRSDTGRRALEQAIELLGLAPLLSRYPAQLSGGEQQRVAIGRALAVSPELLLMDEPLSALDQRRKEEILPWLERLHRTLRIPVLYVTHSRDELARLADHMVLMEDGRIVAQGQPADLLSRPELELSRAPDAGAVLEVKVTGYEKAYGLTWASFDGGHLALTGGPHPEGQHLRVQIRARDVSLARVPPEHTSILNILQGQIIYLEDDPVSRQVIVHLQVGAYRLLSRVSARSAHQLNLQKGQTVFALVKAVAVLS